MKKSEEAMLLTVVSVVVVFAILAKLHKQVKENNRLLKENIALRETREQSK